jgi:hypothetical protein
VELFSHRFVSLSSLIFLGFPNFNFQSTPVFCAGLDVMEMYKAKEENIRKFWRAFQELFKTLYGSRLATVAAINVMHVENRFNLFIYARIILGACAPNIISISALPAGPQSSWRVCVGPVLRLSSNGTRLVHHWPK